MLGDARQYLPEKCLGIATVELGRADQAVDSRRTFAAGVAARKEEVLASQGHASQRTLSSVVVDLDVPVLAVASQRLPATQWSDPSETRQRVELFGPVRVPARQPA